MSPSMTQIVSVILERARRCGSDHPQSPSSRNHRNDELDVTMPSCCESKRILDQLGTTMTHTERESAVVRIPHARPVRLVVSGVGPRGSRVNECLWEIESIRTLRMARTIRWDQCQLSNKTNWQTAISLAKRWRLIYKYQLSKLSSRVSLRAHNIDHTKRRSMSDSSTPNTLGDYLDVQAYPFLSPETERAARSIEANLDSDTPSPTHQSIKVRRRLSSELETKSYLEETKDIMSTKEELSKDELLEMLLANKKDSWSNGIGRNRPD